MVLQVASVSTSEISAQQFLRSVIRRSFGNHLLSIGHPTLCPQLLLLIRQKVDDSLKVRSAGGLYDLIEPENKRPMPIGQFNRAILIHRGGHVEHWLNGAKVIDFEVNSPAMKKLLEKSKFKENPDFHSHEEGRIMFQYHGQKVYFKNIRVRKLG